LHRLYGKDRQIFKKIKEELMSIFKKSIKNIFCLFLLMSAQTYVYSNETSEAKTFDQDEENLTQATYHRSGHLSYYINTSDFIQSFISIPTFNVLPDSTTISSSYLAGRAPVYNMRNEVVGSCSASFLCMENATNILTDISNYLIIDNGLIVSWFTPSTLLNLELDTIVHSMVTECIVKASTKIGFNPFYGKNFNMIVSADNGRIYFKLRQI